METNQLLEKLIHLYDEKNVYKFNRFKKII